MNRAYSYTSNSHELQDKNCMHGGGFIMNGVDGIHCYGGQATLHFLFPLIYSMLLPYVFCAFLSFFIPTLLQVLTDRQLMDGVFLACLKSIFYACSCIRRTKIYTFRFGFEDV